MKTPGFNAESTLDMPTGQYRLSLGHGSYLGSAVDRQHYAVMPTFDEVFIIDGESSSSSSEASPLPYCDELLKCCKDGNSWCCRDYKRDCQE